jgi:hypothetical protein
MSCQAFPNLHSATPIMSVKRFHAAVVAARTKSLAATTVSILIGWLTNSKKFCRQL